MNIQFVALIHLIKHFWDTQPEKELFCKCMDYWQCFATGGQLMSYCSYSNEGMAQCLCSVFKWITESQSTPILIYICVPTVCCLNNDSNNSEKRLTFESKAAVCGRKESDSGIAGFAEPGEWSWHVWHHANHVQP